MPSCHAAHEVLDITAAQSPEIDWSPAGTVYLNLNLKIYLNLNFYLNLPNDCASCQDSAQVEFFAKLSHMPIFLLHFLNQLLIYACMLL